MWIFDIFKSQKKDVIRWENPSPQLLVWQWDKKFDEIKNNSSLILDPSLASIFVHNWKIESIQEEPWKWWLETENTPFISSLKNVMSGFETHDKAQIYFVKTSNITNQKWGTPNSITYIDPIYNFPVELRAFWNFTFKITDLEKFWWNYVANQSEVSIDSIRMILVDRLSQWITSIFAIKKISYNEIDSKIKEISENLSDETKGDFEKLWLELTDFRIEDINFTEKTQSFIDKISENIANVWAVNQTKNIDKKSMENYSELEKLNIAKKAVESWWTAWDMMWAWVWMAMWMNMWNQMGQNSQNNSSQNDNSQNKEISFEDKLSKIKDLLDKKLIDEDDYKKKKSELLENL